MRTVRSIRDMLKRARDWMGFDLPPTSLSVWDIIADCAPEYVPQAPGRHRAEA